MSQKSFTQDEVNAIVSGRLQEDRVRSGRGPAMDASRFGAIVNELTAYAGAKQAYQRAVDALNADTTYSDEYKRETNRRHRDELDKRTATSKATVMQALRTLQEHAKKHAGSFDVTDDKTFRAVTIAQATGGSMDGSTRRALAESFRGNLPALSMLKAAFETQGVRDSVFDELLFVPAEKFTKAEEMARRMYQLDGNVGVVVDELADIARLYGVDVPRPDIREPSTGAAVTKFGMI